MKKTICPAFQSAFIHDEEQLKKEFSYFVDDSVPKVLTASKTRYLIAVPKSYRRRMKALQTVEMKIIYPVPDSLHENESLTQKNVDTTDFLHGEVMPEVTADSLTAGLGADSISVENRDSLARLDSIYVITIAKEKYNTDQDSYMWYFRDILLLPDVRAKYYIGAGEHKTNKRKKNAETGKPSFFKRLFGGAKKKSAPAADSLAMDSLKTEKNQPSKESSESAQDTDTSG